MTKAVQTLYVTSVTTGAYRFILRQSSYTTEQKKQIFFKLNSLNLQYYKKWMSLNISRSTRRIIQSKFIGLTFPYITLNQEGFH